MTKILFRIVFILISLTQNFAQLKINKVEPPNWWTEMKANKIQLMLYGQSLNDAKVEFNTDKIKILKVHNAESQNYLFVDIEIDNNITPSDYQMAVKKDKSQKMIKFPVLKRESIENKFQGFNTDDVIYLVTPDRFANGDESNDKLKMNDVIPRTSNYGRHGGDLSGMISKLDYIKELGFTVIWPNPLIENDTKVSYHGYGATDLYKIDPRFGTNTLYKEFVSKAHEKGMKIILDHVSNHIGIYHEWIRDIPFKDWFNGSVEDHKITPHFNRSIFDPNTTDGFIDLTINGWFVDEMPDLNQKNPFVANYLIQNTIWWIEYSGIDGIREDTYLYPDLEFLGRWAKEILNEYPDFNIVGEVWIGEVAFVAPFQDNSKLNEIDTNLPALLDFPLRDILVDVFANEKDIFKLYETLAKDFLYTDPDNLVTFVDNHDVERIMFSTGSDLDNTKLALQFLLTTRGIPQIYYGTEIGMVGGKDHGSIREDFPGGFVNSNHNAFDKSGRTDKENDMYDFTKKMIKIRKENKALTKGRLYHFPPKDQIYFYVRKSENQKILVILNNSNEERTADISLANEFIKDAELFVNLWTGSSSNIIDQINIPAKKALILEIK